MDALGGGSCLSCVGPRIPRPRCRRELTRKSTKRQGISVNPSFTKHECTYVDSMSNLAHSSLLPLTLSPHQPKTNHECMCFYEHVSNLTRLRPRARCCLLATPSSPRRSCTPSPCPRSLPPRKKHRQTNAEDKKIREKIKDALSIYQLPSLLLINVTDAFS